MTTEPTFSPGAEVEWDLLPPAQGTKRGIVRRITDGTVKVAYLRQNRAGRIVIAETWFEPYELDKLRRVGGAR